MRNHFRNDHPQVRTKICDEDLPMVNRLHIGFHEGVHQMRNVTNSEGDAKNESSWTTFIWSILVESGSVKDTTAS